MHVSLQIFSTTFNRTACRSRRGRIISAPNSMLLLLLREIVERTGILSWMAERLVTQFKHDELSAGAFDADEPAAARQGGWCDQDDADRLGDHQKHLPRAGGQLGTAIL